MEKIKGLYGSFVAIGELVYSDKFYSSEVSASQFKYSRLKLGVRTGNGNTVFCEAMGGFSINPNKPSVIYAKTKDSQDLQIDFKDRFDSNIISTVADFNKLTANLTSLEQETRKEFLSAYDFIEYVKPLLVAKTRVVVSGRVSLNKYEKDGKKKVNLKYEITNIRLAKEDEQNKAEATLSFVLGDEGIDKVKLIKEGQLSVDGYSTVYIKALKENEFTLIPNLVIDTNHLKAITERNVGTAIDDTTLDSILTLYVDYLKAPKGKYIETQWKVDIVSGQEYVEITENDLSQEQKALIQLGVLTFEQAKANMGGGYTGDKLNEIRLIRPTFKYRDKENNPVPFIATTYTEEDFYAKTPQTKDVDSLIEGAKIDTSTADNIARLFG